MKINNIEKAEYNPDPFLNGPQMFSIRISVYGYWWETKFGANKAARDIEFDKLQADINAD